MNRIAIGSATLTMAAAVGYVVGMVLGLYGTHEGPGEATPVAVPEAALRDAADRRSRAARELGVESTKQILFGDLHVHTTFSTDAFQFSLPIMQGEGAHPPADACDFARYCSVLDFWSINDHAEGLTPRRWRETVESIRRCNEVAQDPDAPDVIPFIGWEWTQVGLTAEAHYGHKNVVVRGLADNEVPSRPIAAQGPVRQALADVPLSLRVGLPLLDFPNRQRYFDFDRFAREVAGVPECPSGVHVRELPADCAESAATPAELFEKLAQWNLDTIVIPHGTTWGFYTPPGASWDKQLSGQHDPARQILFEIYSGHGNAEESRAWRAVQLGAQGDRHCPAPSPSYLPSCHRAGEIIRQRCIEKGTDPIECDTRAAMARRHYSEAGVPGWHTVPGANAEEWLDSGQCRDCFLPAFNYRPGGSGQYALTTSRLDGNGRPARFRFGFVASSDNHRARPGTGYKEFARGSMSDIRGPRDRAWYDRLEVDTGAPVSRSKPFDLERTSARGIDLMEFERQLSFFNTGGLAALHARARTRDETWSALRRREVYGTSGDRILLWFNLLNAKGAGKSTTVVPMGGETAMRHAPRFEAIAVGAFRQRPGCPEYSVRSLSPERLEHLCRGECYNPSDERKLIARIEVVRIRPRITVDESPDLLVEDPWLSFACPPDPSGCRVAFEDPDFASGGRDVAYYVRAVQETTLAVNAANLRCRYDKAGNCIEVDPCWGDYRTDPFDDCLAPTEERAWSSPIFVDFEIP